MISKIHRFNSLYILVSAFDCLVFQQFKPTTIGYVKGLNLKCKSSIDKTIQEPRVSRWRGA